MARIQDDGVLRVGTKFDQPLFGLRDPATDEIEGFDVEIARLVAEGIFGADGGERMELVEAPSRSREAIIEEGRVDIVVATYTITEERRARVDFAGPYYVAGQDIMVRAGTTDIRGVDDLNGRRVCTVESSTSLENVRRHAPGADLSVTFDVYSLCAEALADGRVDAVTTDDAILLGLVDASDGAFALVGAPFTEEPYGIGLRRGDDAFREFLKDRLEQIRASGAWRRAYEATIGRADGAPPAEQPPIDRPPRDAG